MSMEKRDLRHTDDDGVACTFAHTVMVVRLSYVIPPKCPPSSSKMFPDRPNA